MNKILIKGFFGMLLLIVIGSSLISGQSYSSASVQYSQPGYQTFSSSDYLRSSSGIQLYYPPVDSSQCGAGQDFLIQIAPAGCTPTVVRSDLLEEQNVPVFCPIVATKLNPLIDVESIDYVKLTPIANSTYSKYTIDYGFHPAKAALKSSQRQVINSPVLNNIGYAVIVLRQQPNESSMPETVSGTLNAEIRYSVENAFGIGSAQYSLQELTDEEWALRYKEFAFWSGNGYLRVENIDSEGATVSIYRDQDTVISRVNLKKGQTSNKIYMPGYYCLAGFDLNLVSLQDVVPTAKIVVDSDIYHLSNNGRFLDNKCSIRNINGKGLFSSVDISCSTDKGTETFNLKVNPSVDLTIKGTEGKYVTGQKITENIFIDEISSLNKKVIVTFLDNEGNKVIIEEGKLGKVSGVDISVLKFSDAEKKTQTTETDFDKYYSSAQSDYKSITDSFSEIEHPLDINSYKYYSERALYEATILAEQSEKYADMITLANLFLQKYPSSNKAKEVQELLDKNYIASSNDHSSTALWINGEVKIISLKSIDVPKPEDFTAKVRVKSSKIDRVVDLSSGSKVVLEAGDYLELDKNIGDKTRVKLSEGAKQGSISNLDLKMGESGISSSKKYEITLIDVNAKKTAQIYLKPSIDYTKTTTNFTFNIGVEKRAIELAPDMLERKIDELNKSIEKWEKISESLGSAVKGLKAACLGTGAALTVKNFVANLGGKSTARQEVMRSEGGWTEICKDLLSQPGSKYVSMDDCFRQNSDTIDKDVEEVYKSMQQQNEAFKLLREQNTVNTEGGKTVDDTKIIDQYITAERKNSVASNLQGTLGDEITLDNQKIKVSDIVNKIDSNGYQNGIYSIQDYQSLERASQLANNPNLSPEAQKFYKDQSEFKLKEIYGNVLTEQRTIDFKNSVSAIPGYGSVSVIAFSDKNSIPGVYTGGISGAQRGSIPTNSFVQGIDYGKEYFVTLQPTSEQNVYSIKENGVYYKDGTLASAEDTKLITNKFKKFTKYDETSYINEYKNPEIKYYETEPYKGMPAIVPFDRKNGWYAATKQTLPIFGGIRAFDDSGQLVSFYLCNVGLNGREQFDSGIGDDTCQMINLGTGQTYNTFPGVSDEKSRNLVNTAIRSINEAAKQYKSGVTNVRIGSDTFKVGNPAANVPEVQCQDFMSPKDCQLLFNVCDPVICPSSRCNLGGTYYVDDVIQTGIVGSIAMCLPNAKEGILVPVCLTGVQAGVDGLLSVYKSANQCYQEALDTGQVSGICDEVTSIYMCEFFWRQAAPLSKIAIPKLLEAASGQGTRGGGEYLSVGSAWSNAEGSVNYFTNYYGAESYKAFKARSTEEAGTEVCKAFISARYPTSGDFFDALIEPDSPEQYHAWFSEIPFTTATVPATSQYKVFYHIYAGKDEGAFYRVYLKNPTGSSLYQSTNLFIVDSGFIGKGEFETQTKDFTAVAGYKELCVSVNAQEECGFKQVTTSFALDYIKESYLKEQASQTDIKSETECISGSPSLYSFVNPNLEEGADDAINPDLYNSGIIRICSTDNPGKNVDQLNAELQRWKQVGYCDSPQNKIACWLDTKSVEQNIQIGSLKDQTLTEVNAEQQQYLTAEGFLVNDSFESLKGQIEKAATPSEKILIIDSNFNKVYYNSQKVQLILMRAQAYGKLAMDEFTKRVKSPPVQPITDVSSLEPTDVPNVFYDVENECYYNELTNTCYVDLQSAAADVTEGESDKTESEGSTIDPVGANGTNSVLSLEDKKIVVTVTHTCPKIQFKFYKEDAFWIIDNPMGSTDGTETIFSTSPVTKSFDISGTKEGKYYSYITCLDSSDRELKPPVKSYILITKEDLTGTAPTTPETTGSAKNCKEFTDSTELSVKNANCISAEKINTLLELTPAKNTGELFVKYGKQYDIDPIIAIAFFNHESNFGTKGIAVDTLSVGNIRHTSSCPGQNYNGFCKYNSWDESISDFYRLLSSEVYVKSGLDSVEKIIPKYAPSVENNVDLYIKSVRSFVLANREV